MTSSRIGYGPGHGRHRARSDVPNIQGDAGSAGVAPRRPALVEGAAGRPFGARVVDRHVRGDDRGRRRARVARRARAGGSPFVRRPSGALVPSSHDADLGRPELGRELRRRRRREDPRRGDPVRPLHVVVAPLDRGCAPGRSARARGLRVHARQPHRRPAAPSDPASRRHPADGSVSVRSQRGRGRVLRRDRDRRVLAHAQPAGVAPLPSRLPFWCRLSSGCRACTAACTIPATWWSGSRSASWRSGSRGGSCAAVPRPSSNRDGRDTTTSAFAQPQVLVDLAGRGRAVQRVEVQARRAALEQGGAELRGFGDRRPRAPPPGRRPPRAACRPATAGTPSPAARPCA